MLDIQSPILPFIANLLNAITGIIIVIGTFISVIGFLKQRAPKGIAYAIISNDSILNVHENIKGKIKILFNEKLVEKVHLVILRIINYGNLPISPKDFEIPLQISFGSNTEILQTEILQTEPANLKNTITLIEEQEKIVINPLLLNSQDMIDLRIILSNFTNQVNIQTRIEGIKDIIEIEDLPSSKSTRAKNKIIRIFRKTIFIPTILFVLLIISAGIYGSLNQIPIALLGTLILPIILYFLTSISAYLTYPVYALSKTSRKRS